MHPNSIKRYIIQLTNLFHFISNYFDKVSLGL